MKLRILLLFLVITNALAQTGIICARVADKNSRQPIPCARLDLTGATDFPPARQHLTNDKGEFTISSVPVGACSLRIAATGHRAVHVPVEVYPGSESIVNVELQAALSVVYDMICPPKPWTYQEPFEVARGKFTIVGFVSEKGTEKRVPSAIVTADYSYADSDDFTRKGVCSTIVADSLGRIVWPNFWPGEYLLWARRSSDASIGDSMSFCAVADTVYRVDFHLGDN